MSPPIKPEAGGAKASAGAPLTSPSDSLSNEQYEQKLNETLQADAPTQPIPPEAPNSGPSFFRKVLTNAANFFSPDDSAESNKAKDEVTRSIPRGLAGAGRGMIQSAFAFGGSIARHSGIGELETPGFNAAYDEDSRGIEQGATDAVISKGEINDFYGARSDDPLAGFTEDATQFTASMLAFQGAGVTNTLASAALADASGFDPYEAQLAELVAKAPVPGLKQLGQLLSVQGDDGPLVARIKRASAGLIAAGVVDGSIAGVRKIRATRTLASATATPVEKEAAAATIGESNKTLQGVVDRTHAAEGEHVIPKQTEEGWTLATVPESPVHVPEKVKSAAVKFEGQTYFGINHAEAIEQSGKELINDDGFYIPGAERGFLTNQGRFVNEVEALDLGRKAEQINARSSQKSGLDASQVIDMEQGKGTLTPPDAPKFRDQAEAEMQATTMNDGINARLNVGPTITPEQATQHFEFAKALSESEKPEDIARLADGTHFNLSYANEPKNVLAQIESISEQFKKGMDAAQGKPGVPIEESFAKARQIIGGWTERDIPVALRTKLASTQDQHAWLLASDMVMKDMGTKIASMSDVLEARPQDVVAHEEARLALGNFLGLGQDLAGANSEVGRTLNILKQRANPLAKDFKFKGEGEAAGTSDKGTAKAGATEAQSGTVKPAEATPSASAVGEEAKKGEAAPAPEKGKKAAAPAPQNSLELVAGMKPREIRAMTRMVKLAKGEPRNVFAVAHAASVVQETGSLAKAFEVFSNFLLSGPKTVGTILSSGASISAFEGLNRATAGVLTGNRALANEGADILYGLVAYSRDNVKAAAATFSEGRSIINPQPQHMAIGGLTGDLIRIPGKAAGAADEFTRISNYRAYVRAKSLRLGREQGLSGPALANRVDEDLRNSFDRTTGIALLPEAMRYAEVPTLSGPLGARTAGGDAAAAINKHPLAKFVVPFVRPGVNAFRYVWKSTPLLNAANAEARAIMMKGGEEAAILHTRSAYAGAMYTAGLGLALEGKVTGRGPADPTLRAMWLKDHQPYSIKAGGQWISYRRLDPIGMYAGLMADASTIVTEKQDDPDTTASDYTYAVFGSIFSNLANKSYLQGLTEFLDAASSNDGAKVERWVNNLASSAVVPQGVSAFNPDSVYREVNGIGDAIISKIPGWSETLPPKFDWTGEVVSKAPGLANRGLNPYTAKPADSNVESSFLELGRGLSPMPRVIENGLVNLLDSQYKGKDNQTAYEKIMRGVSNPTDGRPPLRKAMEDLVRSDKWKDASAGTTLIPGGARWLMSSALKDSYEQKSLKAAMESNPRLSDAIRAARRYKGGTLSGDQENLSGFDQFRPQQ